MNESVYECDEVVVGSGLNAVLYAYFNEAPLILNSLGDVPYFFEFFPTGTDLLKIHMSSDGYELNCVSENKIVGPSKLEAWKRLVFVMSMSGQCALANKTSSIKIGDNIMKVITENSKIAKYSFNKLRIFDDKKIHGLPTPAEIYKKYKIVDWIDVKSGMLHPYDYLETEGEFVKEIYFYPSLRISGMSDKKDLVAISYISEDELHNFDKSSTAVKFKVLNIMKEAGVRGARNGRDTQNPERYKYYAVKVEPKKREIKRVSFPRYNNKNNLVFDYRPEEEILTEFSLSPMSYNFKFNRLMSTR
tara:strand:- start:918 stop:1826 length:909 start_codon:yes stop_codon:yes gene_type:complete